MGQLWVQPLVHHELFSLHDSLASIAGLGSKSFISQSIPLILSRSDKVLCSIRVFKFVFILFIAEKHLSHLAVEGERLSISSTMTRICFRLSGLHDKGLFALHRKIWFGVCKKIENFVITNFFACVIAFALETC